MTKADAAKMAAVIVTAYPNYDKFRSREEVNNYVGLLATMFAADDAAAVGLAVRKHIATSKWPPSIAEIRELMLETTHPEIVPPDLAWAAVSDLLFTLRRGQWDEAKDKLPALIARAVEIIGWKNLYDMHTGEAGSKPGMDRVAFFGQYAPMYDRAKTDAMTPQPISSQITGQQAALPDTSYRLIEGAEELRREKELQLAEQKAENQRQLELAMIRDEEERKARLAAWKAKKERGELDPNSLSAIALKVAEGGQHAQ